MEELQQKQPASTLEVERLSLQLQHQSRSPSCLEQCFREPEKVKDVDQFRSIGNMEDSKLVGVPVTLAGDADLMKTDDGSLTNIEVKVDVKLPETSLVKRKRGRPPKVQARTTAPVKKQEDEEDVCFICFDGGSLVLCDRRGCPKAYHPACIKRDEAFFRSRAKWNCGWHICSICQKASHYMCYTCTYSLCKGCTKDADFLCVRGNFGFCGICMKTIKLIEDSAQGNKEKCEVDFDDKTSWEYLFKVYWVYLKSKLSLTLDELTRAQSPWKGYVVMGPNGQSSRVLNCSRDERFSIPGNSSLYIETSDSKRRKTLDDSNFINREGSKSMKASGEDRTLTLPESTRWASDTLLEFVGHMKNGDTSVLSQFDVQALLLEYIKKNNLHDPLQKCQIICDSRLINLFGKARLGNEEMLKLLELHFLNRENTSAENSPNLQNLDTVAGRGETNGLSENQLIIGGEKRCKPRENIDLQAPESDLNAYAAISSHNIKLIYLCRNQMENLVEDVDEFHQKVVGSIVRVKIPNGDQKPDMYRLVQVIGTSKVAWQYNIGTRTTDLMLEVINLNKKEVISIDGISDQEFSEDECKRFRQSIKCGLSKCLTVREVQEKAMTFQAMRFKNLLNSQEERQHRLHEIPEIHSDPKMDPSYESDDEDVGYAGVQEEKKDDNLRSKGNDFNRKEAESISPRSRNYVLNDARSRVNITLTTHSNQLGGKSIVKNAINPTVQGNEDPSDAMAMIPNLSSQLASDILPLPNLKRMDQPVDDFESDNIWHYQDPSGKTQGPFSLFQLRKWYAAGHFPADLRVWRTDLKKDDSILLTNALNRKCHEIVSPGQFISLGLRVSTDEGDCCKNEGICNSDNSIDQKLKKSSPQHNGSDESVKSNGWNCHLSGNSKHADVLKAKEGQSEGTQTSLDLAKWDVLSHGKSHASQPLPSTAFTAMVHEITSERERKGYMIDINSDSNDGNQNLLKTSVSHGDKVLLKQSDSEGHSGQSSERNWRRPPISGFSGCLDKPSTFISMSKVAEKNQVTNTPGIPSSTAVNGTSDCWDSKSTFAPVTKALQPHEEIDFFDLPSPTPRPSYVVRRQAGESKRSPSSNVPVHDSCHRWSTASSLVGGPVPHPETAVEWREYSTMPAKTSVEEWDSSFVSTSSQTSTKIIGDHAATPSSINCEQTHSAPPKTACNESNWNAIIGEVNEFNSLVDESVSDLLAEVEAMESLGGLDSPTSIMNCGEEVTDGSKNECLSSAEGLSPMPDQGKGDALSSTTAAKLPTHSTVSEAPHAGYQADMLHFQRISTPLPTACDQSGGATKKRDTIGRQWGVADIPVSVQPSTTTWEVTDTTWRLGLDNIKTSWGTTQGNTNGVWSALKDGNPNMNWGVAQGSVHENGSLSSCTTTGYPVGWGTQTRYVNDRLFFPRDGDFHGRDSSFERGRAVDRQPFFGMANGGGSHSQSHRHAPKGQRVCKYYERGHCKKGASCSYWHP